MIRRLILGAAIAVALAGCLGAPRPIVTVIATPTASCLAQLTAWRAGSGDPESRTLAAAQSAIRNDIAAMGDLGNFNGMTAAQQKLATDAGRMLADARSMRESMPPACVPNLDHDYGRMTADAEAESRSLTGLVSAISAFNISAVNTDTVEAQQAIARLNADTGEVTADVNTFAAS